MTHAPKPPAVLVVEDEPDLAEIVRLHLADAGLVPEVVNDGALGLQKALAQPYDLIVLDRMLPGLDGLEVLRRLRASGRTVPVLLLTALGAEPERVDGLDAGADDYVAKPFSVRELMARVRALLRRVQMEHADDAPVPPMRRGDLLLDPGKRKVQIGGEPVELTAKEFDLLALFARHPGRAFSREELLDKVWGYQYPGYSHTVNSHINRLRAKIETDPANPRYVQTVWGVGYRFADEDELQG